MTAPLFQRLDMDLRDEDHAALEPLCTSVEVAAGSALVDAGASDRALYVVCEGELGVLLPNEPAALELRELHPGDLVGEDAFLDGAPHACTIHARTKSRLMRLEFKAFEATLVPRHGPTASRLLLALARRIASRLHAASCVRIENVDDDPELEVLSCLGEMCAQEHRPRQPFHAVSMSAYAGSARPLEGDERAFGVGLAAKILQPLGHELYYGLGERLDIRKYEAGAEIVRAGSRPDGLYLLLGGRAALRSEGAPSPLRREATLEAGAMFGQVAFLLDTPRVDTVRAEEATHVGIIGSHVVQGLMRYADEGRPAGARGWHWIAKHTVADWRLLLSRLQSLAG